MKLKNYIVIKKVRYKNMFKVKNSNNKFLND